MHVKCVLMNQRRDYWCLAVVTDVALLAGYNMCSPTWRWAWQCVSDMGGAVWVGLIFFSHSDRMHVLWSPTGSPHGSVNSERISIFVCEIRASSADRNCWSKQRNTRNILRNKITSHTVSIDQKGNSFNTFRTYNTTQSILHSIITLISLPYSVSVPPLPFSVSLPLPLPPSLSLSPSPSPPSLSLPLSLSLSLSLLQRHSLFRWCPGRDCNMVFQVKESQPKRVVCSQCKSECWYVSLYWHLYKCWPCLSVCLCVYEQL